MRTLLAAFAWLLGSTTRIWGREMAVGDMTDGQVKKSMTLLNLQAIGTAHC